MLESDRVFCVFVCYSLSTACFVLLYGQCRLYDFFFNNFLSNYFIFMLGRGIGTGMFKQSNTTLYLKKVIISLTKYNVFLEEHPLIMSNVPYL